MKVFIDRLIKRTSKFIPYHEEDRQKGIDYWRQKFLYLLILGMIFLGLVAYIPSVYLSVTSHIWSIAIIDTLALLLIIVLAFSKRLTVKAKVNIILTAIYLLGVLLLVFLGPMGAGFIWLFLFPVLAAIFLNFRAVIVCTMILILTFALMAVPVFLSVPGKYNLNIHTPMTWLVNVTNFLVVSFTVSAAVSIILSRLNDSLMKEIQITKLLQKQQEQLKAEKHKAKEADKLKSVFLANMSHEIRTPMNGILGFMNLLKNPDLEESKRQRYFKIIRQSGTRMLGIINDLIDISKIEANQAEINCEEIDLTALIRDTCLLLKPLCDKKKLELECEIRIPKTENRIKTDKNKVIQVLTNLIHNSIKFTGKGQILVKCIQQDHRYEISVHDTGTGIHPKHKEQVFKRFHHSNSEENKKQQGAGLGLAISKAYIEMLGGRIWLESEQGKGSSFYFTLPLNS